VQGVGSGDRPRHSEPGKGTAFGSFEGMDPLHQLEIVILLLMVVLALTTVARTLAIPYPILLVVGGLVLGFVPGLPTVRLDPDLVFLPPIPLRLVTRPNRVAESRWSLMVYSGEDRIRWTGGPSAAPGCGISAA
jgi:hypothetical protein